MTNPLIDSYQEMADCYSDQIKLDLKRTLTDDKNFVENDKIHTTMFNVLLSYAKRNSSIGYCQGMNFLIGMFVRVFNVEEDAFWAFTHLLENILPLDYFCLMTDVLIDQKVFINLIHKKKKKLFKHLQKIGMDFALVSFQWLVCLLSSSLKQDVAEAIWDLVF